MRALKQKFFILIEQVIDVNSICMHWHVLYNELFVKELGKDEKDENPGEWEEFGVSLEHEPIVEEEVAHIHHHVHNTHRYESLVLIQLIELKDLF